MAMALRAFRAASTACAFILVGPAACGALGGCVVENNHPADTRIEFEETQTLGAYCGGPLSSWSVTNRETQEQGTAGCEQPVLFVSLTPGATYTFDIVGYSGNKVCWQGSCSVTAAAGTTSYADCSNSVAHLCGY
jgi:hypothetical protein